MTKYIFLVLALALLCFAQAEGPSGAQMVRSDGPPYDFWTKLPYTSGGTTYICYARAFNKKTSMSVSTVTPGSPTVVTLASAHAFETFTNPTVTLSGATGASAVLNGTYVATIVDSTTVSLALDSSALSSVTGTITMSTNAPRLNQPVWAIQKAVTTSSGDLALLWSLSGFNAVCADRATLSYQ